MIEKNNCPNRETKILYHGTSVESVIGILSSQFNDAKAHAIGIGYILQIY